MQAQEIIDEIKRYEVNLSGILSRFKSTPEGPFIERGDDQLLRRYVRELADLFNDVLGANQYSRQILADFDDGISNYLESPSLSSVESILATVRASLTRFTRMPQLLIRNTIEARGKTRDMEPSAEKVAAGKKIFIGHGRSTTWRILKDFITERLKLPYDEFNAEPVAGITNAARLSKMLDDAGFAFLVLTAEDERADGQLQARMNVIHEVGLFQGRLGFERAIVLLEDGCDEFTNIAGLGHISFPLGQINATFEEVRRVLEREEILARDFQSTKESQTASALESARAKTPTNSESSATSRPNPDAFVTAERAQLFTVIDSTNYWDAAGKFASMWPNSPNMGSLSTPIVVEYVIKNHGRTPGTLKEISHRLERFDKKPSALDYFPLTEIPSDNIVPAGGQTDKFVCRLDFLLTMKEAIQIAKGESQFWFYGHVIYEDVFGGEHEHRFLFWWDPNRRKLQKLTYKHYNESS
jgi:predicted nucleotide-binding protein